MWVSLLQVREGELWAWELGTGPSLPGESHAHGFVRINSSISRIHLVSIYWSPVCQVLSWRTYPKLVQRFLDAQNVDGNKHLFLFFPSCFLSSLNPEIHPLSKGSSSSVFLTQMCALLRSVWILVVVFLYMRGMGCMHVAVGRGFGDCETQSKICHHHGTVALL